MQKRWLLSTLPDRTRVEEFRSTLKVDSVVASLLLQRQIDTFDKAQAFFRPHLKGLHDPYLMQDMAKAVERLVVAINKQEKILLFGDYDVDGTTAVALMYSFLKLHYDKLDYYIPDRYSEGYGISQQGIEFAEKEGFTLIISLDCGIKANDMVQLAKDKGIDFIVCDHHNPGEELPNGIVLDPKRKDCHYPYKELSGCGVGFKFMQAMCIRQGWSQDDLFEHLDLLAISIGADIVPITGENRILCYHGLGQLNASPRTAFKELLLVAKKTFPVSLTNVVFIIAPRINAAGRLRSGRHAVELMISNDAKEIKKIANEINEDNLERRELDQTITAEALEILDTDPSFQEKKSTVVFKADWHKGVIGIVASRLIEKHFKPTIVLTESNGKITGSARTVNDFDIHEALIQCEDLLEQFGGHKHAAGLTLLPENLDVFKTRFEEVVSRTIALEDMSPEEKADIEIELNQIFTEQDETYKLPKIKRILKQLEPHGPGNMKPVFLSKNVFAEDSRLLKEAHLKMKVLQPNSHVSIDAIGFGMHDKLAIVESGEPFDILFTMEANSWQGRETLQLVIKDIRSTL
jgi:single-stranded-DNA-specific exonuclease